MVDVSPAAAWRPTLIRDRRIVAFVDRGTLHRRLRWRCDRNRGGTIARRSARPASSESIRLIDRSTAEEG